MISPIANFNFINISTIADITPQYSSDNFRLALTNGLNLSVYDSINPLNRGVLLSNGEYLEINEIENIAGGDGWVTVTMRLNLSSWYNNFIKMVLPKQILKVSYNYDIKQMILSCDGEGSQISEVTVTDGELKDVLIVFKINIITGRYELRVNSYSISDYNVNCYYNNMDGITVGLFTNSYDEYIPNQNPSMILHTISIFDQLLSDSDILSIKNSLNYIFDMKFREVRLDYKNLLNDVEVVPVCDSTDININEVSDGIVQSFNILPLNKAGSEYLYNVGIGFRSKNMYTFCANTPYYCWIFTNTPDKFLFVNSGKDSEDMFVYKIFNTDGWYMIGKRILFASETQTVLGIDLDLQSQTTNNAELGVGSAVVSDANEYVYPVNKLITKELSIGEITVSFTGFTLIQSETYPGDIRIRNIADDDSILYFDSMKARSITLIDNEDKCYIDMDRLNGSSYLAISDLTTYFKIKPTLPILGDRSVSFIFILQLDSQLSRVAQDIELLTLFTDKVYLKKNGEYKLSYQGLSLDYTNQKDQTLLISIIRTKTSISLRVNLNEVSGNITAEVNPTLYFSYLNQFVGKLFKASIYEGVIPNDIYASLMDEYSIGNNAQYFYQSDEQITMMANSIMELQDYYIYYKYNETVVPGEPSIVKGIRYLILRKGKYRDISIYNDNVGYIPIKNNEKLELRYLFKNIFVIFSETYAYIAEIVLNGSNGSLHLVIINTITSNIEMGSIIDAVPISQSENEFYIVKQKAGLVSYDRYRAGSLSLSNTPRLTQEAVLNEVLLLYYAPLNTGGYIPYDYDNSIITPEESDSSGLNYTVSTLDATALDKAAVIRSINNK